MCVCVCVSCLITQITSVRLKKLNFKMYKPGSWFIYDSLWLTNCASEVKWQRTLSHNATYDCKIFRFASPCAPDDPGRPALHTHLWFPTHSQKTTPFLCLKNLTLSVILCQIMSQSEQQMRQMLVQLFILIRLHSHLWVLVTFLLDLHSCSKISPVLT